MSGVRAVLPLHNHSPTDLAAILKAGLTQRPGPTVGFIGISDPVGAVKRHWVALQEATLASRLCSKGSPPSLTLAFDQTGADRFLLPLVDAGTAGLLEQRLRQLYDLDQTIGSDLFVTVERFLKLGCRPTETSRQLDLHRNSLAARLRSASKVLGGIAIDNENRLMLEVACRLVRLRLAD